MKKIARRLSGGMLAMFIYQAPLLAQAPDAVVAYYTDACAHPESGDLLGNRLTLAKGADGYSAKLQSAQGELGAAAEGRAVVDGASLTFDIDTKEGKHLSFKGRITPEMVAGRYDNGRQPSGSATEVQWRRVAVNEFSVGPCQAKR